MNILQVNQLMEAHFREVYNNDEVEVSRAMIYTSLLIILLSGSNLPYTDKRFAEVLRALANVIELWED